jgi:hypothetical protein
VSAAEIRNCPISGTAASQVSLALNPRYGARWLTRDLGGPRLCKHARLHDLVGLLRDSVNGVGLPRGAEPYAPP